MQKFLTLNPIKMINGTVNLPGSKSISNRVLLLAAQSKGTTKLVNFLNSDDTNCMLSALCNLGVRYHVSANLKICNVHGLGRALRTQILQSVLHVGNAGTVMRSLTAALSLERHDIVLTGDERMKKRPIGCLVDAIKQGGGVIEYLQNNNYPPLRLRGGFCGGHITLNANLSSQFLTSILMMAPLAMQDTYIQIKGILVSRPYIDITLSIMKQFRLEIEHDHYNTFFIKGRGNYITPGDYFIEGDASSASYFLAAAAIRGGTVRVTGIGRNSIQGDVYFAEILEKMGATIQWGENYIECTRGLLRPIDMDMNNIPDSAMTIAILALFTQSGSTTILRNVYNWRLKETDRLSAMANELRKVGANVIEGYDYLVIESPDKIRSATINTYNDHRIAMCFSLLSLSDVSITIQNPQCVSKTFPDFFTKLSSISIS